MLIGNSQQGNDSHRYGVGRGIRCQLGVPFGDSSSVVDCAGTSYSRSSLKKDSAVYEIRILRRIGLRDDC